MPDCTHIPEDLTAPEPTTPGGCTSCLEQNRDDWVHLRECQTCGHVGCCDSSPAHHATAHATSKPDHALVRSMEPGENWWYCYIDDEAFELVAAPPAPTRAA
jgi:hypothetical protein